MKTPTDFTDLHRYCLRYSPTDFTDLHRTFCYRHLCKSVKSVGVFLSRKFCVFCEFCGRL